jgi:flagellar basal body-associated protein FliL
MSAPTTEDAAATQNPAGKANSKGGGSIMPILAVVILVPVVSYVTTEYVLIPKLKAAISAPAAGSPETAGGGGGESKKGEGKKEVGKSGTEDKKEAGNKYAHSMDFGDIIVNLAGAKGTRYLRTRFTLASADEKLELLVKANQDQLRDLAIGVLSGQTLDSLEAPGARNAIRNELITEFNHALHGELVEQLYFADFVVQ